MNIETSQQFDEALIEFIKARSKGDQEKMFLLLGYMDSFIEKTALKEKKT